MFAQREILDGLPLGIVVADQEGRIVLWNRIMVILTGIPASDAEGEFLYQWVPELVEPMSEPGSIPFQARQQWLSLRVQSREYSDGRIWTFSQESRQDLDRARADFVSTVSHELRTPLTSIKGFVDTLLRSRTKLTEAQQQRFLKIIKNQADRLTRLVEDILIVSKIQSGQLKNTPQRLELAEVVDRVIESLWQKFDKHELDLRLPLGLPEVWADQDRLEQILTNLIDNALKYSPEQTTVSLDARVDPEDPAVLWISIRDQGIGIPEDHLAQIFNRFSRVDSPLTREKEGTGLGLYITKSLVESLGGMIHVESQLDRGTTFTFYLPAAQPRTQPVSVEESHA